MKNLFFTLAMATITAGLILLLLKFSVPFLEDRYQYLIADSLAEKMSEEQKRHYYDRIMAQMEGVWETIPEPDVARIGQSHRSSTQKMAEINFNNAGMRSKKSFQEKPANRFRIICLGDSFVMGEGGREEDRFCNQIEDFYRERQITVDGKIIETLAIGFSSWNTVQEATYMSSRISAYQPDIIILLASANDITSSSGVTGKGLLTSRFSPEYRQQGSGIYLQRAGKQFGINAQNILSLNASSNSRLFWDKAFTRLQRLEQVQNNNDGKILFSVLETEYDFSQVFLERFYRSGISAPIILANYFRSPETRLPHDGHPNRLGHSILAQHYIYSLDKLGWIKTGADIGIHQDLNQTINPPLRENHSDAIEQILANLLSDRLDFTQLEHKTIVAMYGGFYPDQDKILKHTTVFSSTHSGFALRKTGNQKQLLEIEVEIPDKVELFPLSITVNIDNEPGKIFVFERKQTGLQKIRLDNIQSSNPNGVIDISLDADHYFTGIYRHDMLAFGIKSARLEKQPPGSGL